MTGIRLVTGTIAMGVVVPVLLFVLLDLSRPIEFFILSITCFVGWGIADLIAMILSRRRLTDRSAREALETWERDRSPDR